MINMKIVLLGSMKLFFENMLCFSEKKITFSKNNLQKYDLRYCRNTWICSSQMVFLKLKAKVLLREVLSQTFPLEQI